MNPLEGLDEVPWRTLDHAYGLDYDVAQLLRALASESPETRWEAFLGLHSAIYHQGTVYEATPYAVPFLIRFFEAPETSEREPIAFLLILVGNAATGTTRKQTRALVAPVLPRLIAALPTFTGTLRTSILYALAEYPEYLPALGPTLEAIRTFEDENEAEPYWQQIIDYLTARPIERPDELGRLQQEQSLRTVQ